MEVDSNTENVSFLALLMAPDCTTYNQKETSEEFNAFSSPNRNFYANPNENLGEFHGFLSANHNLNPFDNTHFISPENTAQFLSPINFHANSLPPLPEYSAASELFSGGFNCDYSRTTLPNLLSLETFAEPLPLLQPLPSAVKCPKLELPPPPPNSDNYSLECILEECLKNSSEGKRKQPEYRQTAAAASQRARRNRVGEKAYCLSKLLPAGYGHRKKRAAMLEAAGKYIKFLEAQVSALKSMPNESINLGEGGGGGGRLEGLTRQQMVQVAVNSPGAQMVMAENGWCVVSVEQVALIQRVQARKKLVQELLAHIPL